MKKAAKAIDKDDKKKMGEEKFRTLEQVRKILKKRNHQSKELAKTLEEIMDSSNGHDEHHHH